MALKLKERSYRRVPKNSTLELEVSTVSGSSFTLNGRVDRQGLKKKSWSHRQLKDKTVTYKLAQTGTSIARISAAFTGTANSSVKVRAKVLKPGGSQHSSTWTATLNGKIGDVARAKIRVAVK